MFYLENDRIKTLKVSMKFSCLVENVLMEYVEGKFFQIVLSRYSSSPDYNLIERKSFS